MEQYIIDKAQQWLGKGFDEETRSKVSDLINYNEEELIESFYKDLEFGTGGLRGIMGVGTNRMNKYTVGMATQGLANYLNKNFSELDQIKAAVAYDSRNNSRYFAEITAQVLSANGIKTYLFDSLRPTPELSFAIRHFGCQSGVVITASHNPKEYNGFKAYWDDGGQLIPPHDKNVINEVKNIKDIEKVNFKGNDELIEIIGKETDDIYLEKIKALSLSPELIKKHNDIKIVYTPLHGTGTKLIPECLKHFGFKNIEVVKEQSVPDGNFPTVKSPNPEEHSALEMALDLAENTDSSLVMATDPDSDRVGIAVKDDKGKLILLNGNQTASILIYYILKKWEESSKFKGNEYIVKTIVTTELLKEIADNFSVSIYDVLTGFKWIAEIIRLKEDKEHYICGGEESYGYLIGDFVRDKDAVSSCVMIAETAAWAAEQGKTLYDILMDIYTNYAYYKESLLSIVRKGKSGAEEIQAIMDNFRKDPPTSINDSEIVRICDYQSLEDKNMVDGTVKGIDLPKSNVLQFFLKDGSKISVRPSGTEPKIKFYFSVNEKLDSKENFATIDKKLNERIEAIKTSLKL